MPKPVKLQNICHFEAPMSGLINEKGSGANAPEPQFVAINLKNGSLVLLSFQNFVNQTVFFSLW